MPCLPMQQVRAYLVGYGDGKKPGFGPLLKQKQFARKTCWNMCKKLWEINSVSFGQQELKFEKLFFILSTLAGLVPRVPRAGQLTNIPSYLKALTSISYSLHACKLRLSGGRLHMLLPELQLTNIFHRIHESAHKSLLQAWRKRWLVMEFPQSTNEEEGEGTDLDGLRSVLVRVYSSHIHENREDGKFYVSKQQTI